MIAHSPPGLQAEAVKRKENSMAKRRKKRRSQKGTRLPLPIFLILLLLAALFGGKTLLTEDSSPAATLPEESAAPAAVETTLQGDDLLTVYYIDVGQGDCELLESGGEYLLIDAGGDKDLKSAVQTFLSDLGVESLSYVVATHPHADHIQEMTSLIGSVDIGTFYLPDVTTDTATFEKMVDALTEQSVNVEAPQPGDTFSFGSCTALVVGPVNPTDEDMNASSLVVQVTCGENTFLFTGDCTAEEEADILAWASKSGVSLDSDVLKVAHHGSSTSSSQEFLDAVSPSFAVISCGVDNSYGHPHQEVMDRLAGLSLQLYRTDTMGTITAHCDGTTIRFTTEKEN
jgi:beta-lactamase superfamily II metal-dependent hydrolase